MLTTASRYVMGGKGKEIGKEKSIERL